MWPCAGQHVESAAARVERRRALGAVRVVVGADEPRVRRSCDLPARGRTRRAPRARPPATAARPAARARPGAPPAGARGAATARRRASGRSRPARSSIASSSRSSASSQAGSAAASASGRSGIGTTRRPSAQAAGQPGLPVARAGALVAVQDQVRGRAHAAATVPDVVRRLDVSALRCPMTWVRTKLELERLAPGETLEVDAARRARRSRTSRARRARPATPSRSRAR